MKLNKIGLILFILAAVTGLQASDVNKGYAFTQTDRVTNTKLNNLVDAATINTTFFTDKTAQPPLPSDVFLMVRSGDYYRTTLGEMVLNNAALITSQSEDLTPATGDWLLTYDISASSLKKIQLMSVWTNDFLINGRAALTNTPGTTLLLGYDTTTGVYGKTTLSNLFQQSFSFNTFTNLALHTAPTNDDRLLIFDSLAGTNKQTTLSGFYTNLPTLTTNSAEDYLVVVTNGTPSKLALKHVQGQTLATNVSSYIAITEVIPYDNTIPQNTEGRALFGMVITPRSLTSLLEIEAVIHADLDGVSVGMLALFQDANADALSVSACVNTSTEGEQPHVLRYVMPAGTTSPTTFYLRAGVNTGSMNVNGSTSTGAKFGGRERSYMIIREIPQ